MACSASGGQSIRKEALTVKKLIAALVSLAALVLASGAFFYVR